ncbi:MAG: cold shock domain-containing protein [Proteobacteria bacterium]|nr:cold shock domain-containing protein [Pseudomonadota bacterium]
MGKGKDFRDPRRRGFDDDFFVPEQPRGGMRPGGAPRGFTAGPPEGPVVDATVKWFNPEKGFGFAELSDGTGDAFLHIGVLQAAGKETVPPGSKLKVHVGQGQKGRQITHVLEVDESAASDYRRPPRPAGGPGGGPRTQRFAPDPSTAVELSGTVKWFNGEKGFGFVTVADGGKDVFLHISVLERAQLTHLAEGQRVSMRVVDTPKGREAISIALAS